MTLRQKIFIIIIAILFLISLFFNLAKIAPETRNYDNYTHALKKYNNKSYADAYYLFAKVSRFSKLKPAAIYRQALCADRLGDQKAEEKRYKQIIRNYPHSTLALRSRYLKAQLDYENKNNKKATSEFRSILNKYPKTDYALAANYYLGSIQVEKIKETKNGRKKEKLKKKAALFFKTYLKEAPNGKFAMNCIQKWVALDTKLNNEDNLLIAIAYQANQNYKNAEKYLLLTNLNSSWQYFVKNAYETKNYSKVKYYTEQGLKREISTEIPINEVTTQKDENESVFKAIDAYLKVSNNPKLAISYLLSISQEDANGKDYLLFKNCNNLQPYAQPACFNTLYYKYPNGQFAAEALANIFYDNIQKQNYNQANKLGRQHLREFKNVKSSPKVIFWLAKLSERTKNYDSARGFYKQLLREYPDDYYSYHAFLNLNRLRYFTVYQLNPKPILFPYKENNELIAELLKVKDYGLINQLYSDDDFIKSWLLYQQGNYSASAKEARDAMDKVENKPDRGDLRWRLVYPLHYLEEIKQNSQLWHNDSTLILSIIREESYFNPLAKSPVGARGLMQLMPATANEAASKAGILLPNQELLYDPNLNIKLGNVYYSTLKKTLSGNDAMAVLAYNGGVGSVTRWRNSITYYDADDFVEQIPYPETQNYLKKVYRSYWNYLRIYEGIKF